MKKLIIAILIIMSGQLHAQTIDEIKESGQFIYGISDNRTEAVDQVFMALSDYMEQESECDSTNWESKLHDLQYGNKVLVYLIKKDLLGGEEVKTIEVSEPVEFINDEQIIRRVVDAGDYQTLKEYLKARHNNFHDIYCGSVQSGLPGIENCYWVIFDNDAKIIAVVDKDGKNDILNGRPIHFSDYQNNQKIWLQIYYNN